MILYYLLLLIILYYNALLHHPSDNQHSIPLNFSVKQIFNLKVMDQAELVKLRHQTEGLNESLIPELVEERIIIVRFAVKII